MLRLILNQWSRALNFKTDVMVMKYIKAKWFVYTVLVALIPFFSRMFIYMFLVKSNYAFLINETDWVAFGLILHITNINELEHVEFDDRSWKTMMNGISIICIVIYSVIFSVATITTVNSTLFNVNSIKVCSVILSIVSLVFSFSLYDKVAREQH